jgi:hypothetical protein
MAFLGVHDGLGSRSNLSLARAQPGDNCHDSKARMASIGQLAVAVIDMLGANRQYSLIIRRGAVVWGDTSTCKD